MIDVCRHTVYPAQRFREMFSKLEHEYATGKLEGQEFFSRLVNLLSALQNHILVSIDVASINSGEPLARSYSTLKERIHAAGLMSEPGLARQKPYEEHESSLHQQCTDQDTFRSYLETNRERLLELMQDASSFG